MSNSLLDAIPEIIDHFQKKLDDCFEDINNKNKVLGFVVLWLFLYPLYVIIGLIALPILVFLIPIFLIKDYIDKKVEEEVKKRK